MTEETITLNLGPQHPSTHGVLRVLLELDGEIIVDAKPDIGFLHRGLEKLSEHRTYQQILVLTDRIDYLAAMSNNFAYVLAVEKLLELEVPKRAQYIRVALVELQRIASHLFWLGTHAHDLGAMTPLFYTLREREDIMDIFEAISGGRLTPSFMRFGGLAADADSTFVKNTKKFTDTFAEKVDDYENLLTENPMWLSRTRTVGMMSREFCINTGISGPMARAAGIEWDLRKSNPYSSYEDFDFAIPTGLQGDVFDCYMMRIREMRESAKIVSQAVDGLPESDGSPIKAKVNKFPAGEVYHSIESPRGELGFYIVSDGGKSPARLRVRPPSFVNLQGMGELVKGRLLSDVVAIIGMIDIVLAEVDR